VVECNSSPRGVAEFEVGSKRTALIKRGLISPVRSFNESGRRIYVYDHDERWRVKRGEESMNLWKGILVAAVMSWAYSVTLGLLLAVAVSEDHSLRTLLLPAVVPVALIGSTIVAIAITPVAIWSVRTGARNLWFYGPILWIALAAYIVFVFPKVGYYGRNGLFVLAVLGLVVLGFIPPK
jgi:hypothetical protein